MYPHQIEGEPVEIWQTAYRTFHQGRKPAIGVHTNAGTCPHQEVLSKEEDEAYENASPRISMDIRIEQQNSLAVNLELNEISELEVEKKNST
uniref:Uncharacterized protein n=1 Tax=Oryza glumipatula TaxID=40148 RepID=A0A0E0BL29_9ORYZ